MKRTSFITLTVSITAIFLVASLVATNPVSAEAYKWPKSFTISVQSQQSPMYAVSVGWSSVMEKQTGMKLRVTAVEIGSQRLRSVATGKIDTCTESAPGMKMALEGLREHAIRNGGPFHMRILWTNFLVGQAIMVRGDSNIKSMSDLKPGMKVSVHPGGGPRITLRALLAYAGLKEDDVNIIEFGSMEGSMRAVVDGKTECCASDPGHPLNIEFASSPHGIRFLSLDLENQKGINRLLGVSQAEAFGKPVLAIKDARDLDMIIQSQMYLVSDKADPEFIYNLVKWIDENYDSYKESHPTIRCMSIDVFRKSLDASLVPVHPGVVRYLKEKGMWTAKDDERQKYNTQLIDRYIATYKSAIAEADKKKIKIDPQNKEWMNLWADHKKDLPVFKSR